MIRTFLMSVNPDCHASMRAAQPDLENWRNPSRLTAPATTPIFLDARTPTFGYVEIEDERAGRPWPRLKSAANGGPRCAN